LRFPMLRHIGLALAVGVCALSAPLAAQARKPVRRRAVHHIVRRYVQTWTARPIAYGLGDHDVTGGEDPEVRAAAVRALGNLNGTAVVVDPNNGRILAMVNQKLALSAQYQPCSTTKMAIALAALDHHVVNENTPIQVAAHWSVNLTTALAYSINAYFEALGDRMGFATVTRYEREMGLGEKAGWNIPGEDPGVVPDEPGPGGVAKLSSFGEGVHISPLQLAAIVTAIANGGTLYWLQHPTTPEQVRDFVPRVKRHLDIAALAPEVKDGMLGAVQYGTAKLARLTNEQILGKTGTCSRDGTRFGLFASYLGITHPQLVVVVILRGNGAVFGPRAAQVAGVIYRRLDNEHFFEARRGAAAWPTLQAAIAR
jgi:penicillin-binding protein 2